VAPGYGPTSGLLDGMAVLARNQEPRPRVAETSFRVARDSPRARFHASPKETYGSAWHVILPG